VGRLGANPTTHLATIRYPVQNAPVISVVKLLPPQGHQACNEAIAWLFLRAAGVAIPKHAALLAISERKMVAVLGRKAVAKHLVSNGYVMAWAAQKLNFASIQVMFAGHVGDDRWLKAMCTLQGAAIAAFDEAFLNVDRNTGNILFMNNSAFVPIDHEMIFGLQPWNIGNLIDTRADSDSLACLKKGIARGRVTQDAYNMARNRMVMYAQSHALALQACEQEVKALLLQVYPDEGCQMASRVLSFVTERTLLEWMADRLGVV